MVKDKNTFFTVYQKHFDVWRILPDALVTLKSRAHSALRHIGFLNSLHAVIFSCRAIAIRVTIGP